MHTKTHSDRHCVVSWTLSSFSRTEKRFLLGLCSWKCHIFSNFSWNNSSQANARHHRVFGAVSKWELSSVLELWESGTYPSIHCGGNPLQCCQAIAELTQTHTCGWSGAWSPAGLYVFGMWQENGEIPTGHRETRIGIPLRGGTVFPHWTSLSLSVK